jgi:hypothetical protein
MGMAWGSTSKSNGDQHRTVPRRPSSPSIRPSVPGSAVDLPGRSAQHRRIRRPRGLKIDTPAIRRRNSGSGSREPDFDDFAQQYDCPLSCDFGHITRRGSPRWAIFQFKSEFRAYGGCVLGDSTDARLSAGRYSFDASTHFLRASSGLPSQTQHPKYLSGTTHVRCVVRWR